MKKYEIALLYGGRDYESAQIVTYEYDTLKDFNIHLQSIIEEADSDLYKIELSVLEQDEDGSNLNTHTFCDIDFQLYLKEKF